MEAPVFKESSRASKGTTPALDRSSKRRKVGGRQQLEVEESLSEIRSATVQTGETCTSLHQHPQESMSEVRRRLRAIEEREKGLAERERTMMDRFLDYERRHQEILNKRQKDFEEWLNRRRRDVEELLNKRQRDFEGWLNTQRNYLKAEKAELKQEKAEFNQEQVNYMYQTLIIENRLLEKNLNDWMQELNNNG